MDNNELEVPQSGLDDVGHTALATILGLVPFVGAAELFKAAIPPPLEKRRDKWMQDVKDAIIELQNKGLTMERLRDSEEFISLLIQTTQAALKTHLDAKHKLLKNALVNSMSLNTSFDSKQLYLNMVERFSPTHVSILSLVNRNKMHTVSIRSGGEFYDKLKQLGEIITLTVNGIDFMGFLEDLHKAGLIIISDDFIISDGDVHQVQTRIIHSEKGSKLQKLNLTDLGYKFLRFIEE